MYVCKRVAVFVCGSSEGTMQLYEKDEKDGFKKKPPFTLKNNPGKVTNLALAPSEDVLLCTTDNNQAYVYAMAEHGGRERETERKS